MTKIKQHIIPVGLARPGLKRTGFKGVTIHETDNISKGAGAISHAKYLQSIAKTKEKSWHYCVDSKLITQSVPEDETAWCNGDGGNGTGNRQTISIEICVNPESDFEIARQNAAELTADILVRNGIKTAKGYVFQHNNWSGKNCPKNIRAKGLWTPFLSMVQAAIDAKGKPVTTPEPSKPDVTQQAVYHTVKKGDSRWSIGQIYGVSVAKITELNPQIKDWANLKVGTKLLVKKGSESTAQPKIVVGSLVKITGTNYATGEKIPQWVKEGKHKVAGISGGKALLGANGGINSWLYLKDLKLA